MNERYYDYNENNVTGRQDYNERVNRSAYNDGMRRVETQAFSEQDRRFKSEAPSRQSRIGRLFGGETSSQRQESGFGTSAQQPFAGSYGVGTVIYSPTTYEDVKLLIDHLKRREQVIVDFSSVDQTAVYRILDYMSGAIYALNGSIQQISKNIFLFAPSGVTITVPPHLGRK